MLYSDESKSVTARNSLLNIHLIIVLLYNNNNKQRILTQSDTIRSPNLAIRAQTSHHGDARGSSWTSSSPEGAVSDRSPLLARHLQQSHFHSQDGHHMHNRYSGGPQMAAGIYFLREGKREREKAKEREKKEKLR